MRLKLYILTALISGILLISCSSINEDIDTRKAISFSSTIVKADWKTKGAVDNQVNTVGVMAFLHPGEWADSAIPNLMYDGELKKDGNNWNISPNIYWPPNPYKTSFFAYSPKATTGDNNNGITLSGKTIPGVPTVTYQMPELAIYQSALMLAKPVLNQNYESNNGKVVFELSNALAAIGFHITGDALMIVKSIGISNIIDEGTISMDSGKSLWECEPKTERLYNAGLKFDDDEDYVTPILPPSSPSTTIPEEINGTSINGYLMVIPQTLAGAKVVLALGDTSPSAVKTIALTDATKWEANKQYIYIINLSISGDVTITIEDWGTTDDEIVTDPL